MSTTFPTDLTTERFIEFLAGPNLGTIRTISMEEIGRDVYLAPSPTADDAAGAIMLMMAFQGSTGEQIRAWLHDQPEAVAYRERPPEPEPAPEPDPGPTPPPIVLGQPCEPLVADGVTMRRQKDSARVSLCGHDQFTAIRMVLDGVDLQPYIDESMHYGFNLWRVFAQASSTENGYYTVRPDEPNYDLAVTELVERLSEVGIYLLLAVFADNQVLNTPMSQWLHIADVLRPYQDFVFLSGGNEADKNGFDPYALQNPNMKWWSRGSWTIEKGEHEGPPDPEGATFCEYHNRRDYPKGLDDTVASQTYIQFDYRYVVPLFADEPPRMGTDGSGDPFLDPAICWRYARNYASGWAAAVLHMRCGQKAALIPPGSIDDAIASAWAQGMRIP